MPIDVYDKPKFIETCEIDCGSLIHDEDLSLSLFQFSLLFQLFRMMKFYSFLVVLNMVEEASKKVYVSDIVVYWKYNYLFVVQRIFLFARFSIFPLRKNFSFHLYLSSIFIGIAYPILLHAIALALSLDYSWTRLDCTENSNKMELEEFGMKSSFDKLSSCVHCEIRTFSSFLFSLSPNAEI